MEGWKKIEDGIESASRPSRFATAQLAHLLARVDLKQIAGKLQEFNQP
jgi:hypothetical protein